jgi:hypothetical protein
VSKIAKPRDCKESDCADEVLQRKSINMFQ